MNNVLKPASEAELAEMVGAANAKGQALRIRGGGTKLQIGNPVVAETHLETTALSGISIYEPGALTLVAQAGTPLAEIQTALDKENQHLPFEPADYRSLMGSDGNPTIGGVTAAAVSGPRRIQAGACRDSLIGVRFVVGNGEIIKNGGRVMKNVTGYDLVKLLCGSYGTLGVLTEVSYKLLPKPEAVGTVTMSGLDDQTAIAALSKALGSPFDVNGAAHLQNDNDEQSKTLVRVEGFEGSVKYRCDALQALLKSFGEVEISLDTQSNRDTWADIRDVKPFAGKPGAVWKVSVKPGDAPSVVAAFDQSVGVQAIYDWGGGLVWLLMPETDQVALTASAARLRKTVSALGGHATLFRASQEERLSVGSFHPQQATIARISAGIKTRFDPSNILNPGLMVPKLIEAAE